jgi:hypothetical protein
MTPRFIVARRGASNLEEERLRKCTLAAAEAAVRGDQSAAHESLRGAFGGRSW